MLVTSALQTAAWERLQGSHHTSSPEEYLGTVPLQYLSTWLEAKGLGSFKEAVDFEVKKLMSNGKAPYALGLAS